ncbi:MAG: DUF4118 domain-containing protein [Oscillospiraceae bacterium]
MTYNRLRKKRKTMFVFSVRDTAITLICFALATVICAALKPISDSDSHVPLVFVLTLLIISATTDGYFYGFLGSVIAVFGVNFVFTYPYFRLNFSLTGYPLTFICMFAVSILTCTLTSRVRESEKVKIEAEKEKMRANLLRAISHDFRTPLTSIIGSINAVQESGELLSEQDKQALLSDARSDAEWLINMVENLLSITRIGADPGARLHKELQPVEEVIGEAVARFRKQYPELKVLVSVPDRVLMVPMDAVLIEQVIMNLLINAAIHGKTATCAALSVRQEGDFALFTVSDDGEGIHPRKLDHLFDGYSSHQGLRPVDDATRTMGIGLSVCKTIIDAHGGEMSAKNRPEGGAELSFTLPLDGAAGA